MTSFKSSYQVPFSWCVVPSLICRKLAWNSHPRFIWSCMLQHGTRPNHTIFLCCSLVGGGEVEGDGRRRESSTTSCCVTENAVCIFRSIRAHTYLVNIDSFGHIADEVCLSEGSRKRHEVSRWRHGTRGACVLRSVGVEVLDILATVFEEDFGAVGKRRVLGTWIGDPTYF